MIRGLILLITVLISSHAAQDYEDYTDNAIDLIPTSISALEEFISRFSNPFRIFNRPDDQVDNNAERFILSLPWGIRDVFNAGRALTRNGFGDVMDQHKNRIHAIFPGTRWCGTGDVARSSNDLGFFGMTDTCCKIHDSCPEYINAGSDNRGLKNNGIFSRSHCSCDEEFHRCLRKTRSFIADKIGVTYFDILQPQCFKLEYPIKRCIQYTSFPGSKRCLRYEFDTNANKTWQWFDNRHFLIQF